MSRVYPYPLIAKEGWPFIIGSLVLSILTAIWCGWWSLPLWALTVFVVQFFRDPARDIPTGPEDVLSPADGRIVVLEKTTDPYRGVNALKISVFMNVFNVHSNRCPIDGKVERVDYFKGSFLNASMDKASVQNERNAVLAVTKTGRPVTFVQVAGLVARRILCYVNAHDILHRGNRYGLIRFGSRVDVYLPEDATALVAIGDKVRASSTVLATLPLHAPPAATSAPENGANSVDNTTEQADMVKEATDRAALAAQHVLSQE
ncbi:MAG: phosphatidylserine decarboxylase [Snodgrassella sp.]|uniref:Phosphatidylserine decarboxylase proenzyme n=1 Tax=Snodgrassella alvi TaxID=1196083 RepID=A0A2N9XWP0_9NEIS|nr:MULTISPECIES: phosphatidylserine decarboxylase [Snodgrassella]MCO6505631.1 phosphatidylserine decarboxylase [Snodgrassella sp.]MCO6508131.1 phosphatidylserine decarboxylase [Snodgrassella sp.]MCO6513453.1 phosphatidylserine decarboxylase [Snodgrassella sp.]MCO6521325.1 phosphatidylserine decarboxylase [Snodgrassella sp.]MCO6523318.1 phosphatidylserine decarboxylase [Snodgrassella sp.]